MQNAVARIELDGVELSLYHVNGQLRVAAEGIDLGPVRGIKRLAGPDLAPSMTGTKDAYRRLAATAEYRAYIAPLLA